MKKAALTVINFMDLPHDYSATSMFMTRNRNIRIPAQRKNPQKQTLVPKCIKI
ncbi:hypothetical protein FC12_GL002246 [Lacticaseibacillus paracasei subsp. tolerans DSM 20258]|nr:hypothetical protein FC12_GL002246 [Lacticaseibacillus paracasei subsp. tolerans DSM 20258]